MKILLIFTIGLLILLSLINISCSDFIKDYEYKPAINVHKVVHE